MAEVWLVERQGVEDPYVIGAFNTEEKAVVFQEQQEDPHGCQISIWEIQ